MMASTADYTEPSGLIPALSDQLDEIEALVKEAFHEYALSIGQMEAGPFDYLADAISEGRVYVYTTLHHIRGVIVLAPERDPTRLILQLIAVAKDEQGQGIGTALMEGVLALGRRHFAKYVELWTAAHRTELVAFYSRLGFVVTRVGPPAHGRDAFPRVTMEYNLQDTSGAGNHGL